MTIPISDGLTEIIETYQDGLAGFIRARVGSEEESEDILQEVWYQLSKKSPETEFESVSGWLYHVARNKIIDSYRKKSTDLLEEYLYDEEGDESYFAASLLAGDDDPELTYLREQFWEELYEALESLPAKQREVFVLNELEGTTLREIAEQNGEKLKTIISRKGYAVRQLRERLQVLFEEWMED